MDKRDPAELEKEILDLLLEARADSASLLVSSDECLAVLKETNAMLAAHRRRGVLRA